MRGSYRYMHLRSSGIAVISILDDRRLICRFRRSNYKCPCFAGQLPRDDAGYTVNGINGVGMISDAVAESDLITKYLPSGSIIVT
ncbi:hypothetical protein PUN28_002517 [Cardiocondyla obscurior]|uniref:Uncharacterized protein n=1 Tax=Cardiocondyla obscurior TaxID=286306 RepID=A0AAW2GUT1_9HYME